MVNAHFVFVISLAVYVCLALRWHWAVLLNTSPGSVGRLLENTTGDEPHYILIAMNLVNYYSPFIETTYRKVGWPIIDWHSISAIDGHFVSVHGIGLPLLIAVPVKFAGAPGAALVSTVVMAATNFFVYKLVENYTRNRKIAFLTALIMAFSTPMLVYSIGVWTEIYAGLIITFATYEFLYVPTTRSRAALLGVVLGYLPLLRYDYLILSLIIGAYGVFFKLRKKKPELILFAVGMLAMFSAVPIYQLIAFGNPFAMTNRFQLIYHFPAGMLVGAAGQLVDGVHGLFIYAPLFYLLILGLPFFLRKLDGKIVAAIVCTEWLLMSSWVDWLGGWSYASRHLVAVMPLLSLPLAETIQRFGAKKMFVLSAAILVIYGILVNSVSLYFRTWGGYSVMWISRRLLAGFNVLDILPKLSPPILLYLASWPTISLPPTYDWIVISVTLFLIPFAYFLRRVRRGYLRLTLSLTSVLWDLSLLYISLNITSWSGFALLSNEIPADALFLLGVAAAAGTVIVGFSHPK